MKVWLFDFVFYRIELGGMKPLFNGHTCRTHSTHGDMCSLLLTHPSTRSLVLGAKWAAIVQRPGSNGSEGGRGVSGALLKGTTAGQEVNWDLSK